METQKNIKTDCYGQPILSSDDLVSLLMQGKSINRVVTDSSEDIELYKKFKDALLIKNVNFSEAISDPLSFDDFYVKKAKEWLFPLEFQTLDVYNWLLSKCATIVETNRVKEEYALYEKYELIMLLRFFVYLVDYMRNKDFIWGIGRGSAVNSFILYLIGVHRVNSLFYELSITDFLK